MIFSPLALDGCFRIDLEFREDARGRFARTFCAEEFRRAGLNAVWPQMNSSLTRRRGTVRGLHFQRAPRAEIKLVRCMRGAVWDMAVDLRAGSASFGQSVGLELSAENGAMIYIPQGFAHGFQALSDDAELLYFHSEVYSPDHEGAVSPEDAALGLAWPLPVTGLSARDSGAPTLDMLEPLE